MVVFVSGRWIQACPLQHLQASRVWPIVSKNCPFTRQWFTFKELHLVFKISKWKKCKIDLLTSILSYDIVVNNDEWRWPWRKFDFRQSLTTCISLQQYWHVFRLFFIDWRIVYSLQYSRNYLFRHLHLPEERTPCYAAQKSLQRPEKFLIDLTVHLFNGSHKHFSFQSRPQTSCMYKSFFLSIESLLYRIWMKVSFGV